MSVELGLIVLRLLISFIPFLALLAISVFLCLCLGKELLLRLNRQFKMGVLERAHVNVVKYDYEAVGGAELAQKKLDEARKEAADKVLEAVVLEEYSVVEAVVRGEKPKPTETAAVTRPNLKGHQINLPQHPRSR